MLRMYSRMTIERRISRYFNRVITMYAFSYYWVTDYIDLLLSNQIQRIHKQNNFTFKSPQELNIFSNNDAPSNHLRSYFLNLKRRPYRTNILYTGFSLPQFHKMVYLSYVWYLLASLRRPVDTESYILLCEQTSINYKQIHGKRKSTRCLE